MKEILYAVNSFPTAPVENVTMDVTPMAVAATFSIAYIFVVFAILIFIIVAFWKLLKKAGQPGWAAIVPFYSNVVLSKVAGVNIWFYLGILIAAVIGLVVPIISIFSMIALGIWNIVIAFKLPGKFGKGVGFGFGLWLLPVIFYPILAFGKSEYQG